MKTVTATKRMAYVTETYARGPCVRTTFSTRKDPEN